MKKNFNLPLIVLLTVFIQIPASAMGLFYTNATYPVTATGNEITDFSSLKCGTSKTTNVLFLFETGDASIDKAAKEAGITKITHIDVNEKSVFIFWRRLTVTVWGE